MVSIVLEKQQKARETKLAFLAVHYGGAFYEGKKKKITHSCFKHLLLQVVHSKMISDVSTLFQTAVLFKIFASRVLIPSRAKQLIPCDVQVVLSHLLMLPVCVEFFQRMRCWFTWSGVEGERSQVSSASLLPRQLIHHTSDLKKKKKKIEYLSRWSNNPTLCSKSNLVVAPCTCSQ